jgi:O-antigen/teichoic acid export membrane protein
MVISFIERIKKNITSQDFENIGYIGVANIIFALSQWAVLSIITKLSTIDNVGKFSISLAIITPVSLFLGANLRTYISTDINRNHSFSDYFITRLITLLLGFIILIIIGIGSSLSNETLVILYLIYITKIVEGLQEVCWGINQRAELMKPVGVSRIIRSILCVLSVGISLLITKNLNIAIMIWIISWTILLIVYDIPQARKNEIFKLQFKVNSVKEIIIKTIPLALISGILAINDKASQYQITAYLGENVLGFFAPIAFVVQGIGLAITAITETSIPRLAKYFTTNRRQYMNHTLKLVGSGFIIGMISLFLFGSFSDFLIPLMYTKEYLAYKNIFLLLLISGVIRYSASGFGAGLTAALELKKQIPILVITLLITIVSGIKLIPIYKTAGAAISIIIGLLFTLISYAYLWLMTYRKPID